MQCPKCELYNPDEAMRCDCGYDFDTAEVKDTFLEEKQQTLLKAYTVLAWFFALMGGVIGIYLSYPIAFSRNIDGYKYDFGSRKKGEIIFFVSIVIATLFFILGCYGCYRLIMSFD